MCLFRKFQLEAVMKKTGHDILWLVLLVLWSLSSCDDNHKPGGDDNYKPRVVDNIKKEYLSSIEWNDIDIVVIALEQIPETLYYILNDSKIQELITAIEKTTTPQGSGTQYIGTDVLICSVKKNGDPSHYFWITLQGVKGMGDKTNPSLDKNIFKSQQENRDIFIELIKANSKQVSEEQVPSYIQELRSSKIKMYMRYWKK